MPQIHPTERPAAPQRNAANTGTYIRPTIQKKKCTYGKLIALLCTLLLLSLTLLVCLGVALSRRITAYEEAVVSLQVKNEEQRLLLELMEAEATAIRPIDEPKIDHAVQVDTTQFISGIDSKYAILIDIDKNEIVASKSGNERIYPASMTKVMTLIVAAEHITDTSELFTFDYTITDPAYKAGASVAGFLAGESVPLLDVLYGAALPSGADATTALAITVAGNEEIFAELMNKKAEEIGLTNTHFENASGLHHPDHYSTPHEIAMIMEYAMEIPLVSEILCTYQYTTTKTEQHPDGILLTSNMFSRMYGDEAGNCEVIAGKTGYTPEAGQCLVSVAQTPDGRRFVLVTASAVGRYAPIYDAIDVYKNYIPDLAS